MARIEGIRPRGWFYGWMIFLRSIWIQSRKRHGVGRQPWKIMLRIASQQRWIVYGQHRRACEQKVSD